MISTSASGGGILMIGAEYAEYLSVPDWGDPQGVHAKISMNNSLFEDFLKIGAHLVDL